MLTCLVTHFIRWFILTHRHISIFNKNITNVPVIFKQPVLHLWNILPPKWPLYAMTLTVNSCNKWTRKDTKVLNEWTRSISSKYFGSILPFSLVTLTPSKKKKKIKEVICYLIFKFNLHSIESCLFTVVKFSSRKM